MSSKVIISKHITRCIIVASQACPVLNSQLTVRYKQVEKKETAALYSYNVVHTHV